MANTYTLIASSTVGSGGAAYIEFTSIPNTYTDLLVSTSLRDNRNISLNDGTLKINGSDVNFHRRYLETTNSASPTGDSQANNNYIYAVTTQGTASTFSNGIIYIPNYLSSNYKSIMIDNVSESNGTPNNLIMIAGLWSDTSAITSLRLTPSGASINYVQYSTAYLYGISNS